MEPADVTRENTLLKARLTEVEATLAETQEANRRLQNILRVVQREKFGKRSDKSGAFQTTKFYIDHASVKQYQETIVLKKSLKDMSHDAWTGSRPNPRRAPCEAIMC